MVQLSRRQIIAASAATAAGLAGRAAVANAGEPAALYGTVRDGNVTIPSLHAPSEGAERIPNREPPGRRLGVAVVGLGHLALEQIIPAFGTAKNVRLAALVSGHADIARAVAGQEGVPATHIYDYANFDALRNNGDVDIVYIVLPNAMHADYTERAAAAGKHVLCEKPMATSVPEAERMIRACKAADRKLMIAYRLQYNATHRALIKMVRDEAFGPLRFIEAVNGQNDAADGQWRQIKAMSGGGSLVDVGIYCFNAFRYLTGEEPIEVTGQLTQPEDDPRFREVEDIATFTLRFPSGVLATGSSGYSFHNDRRLRCAATEAWFGADPAFSYDGLAMHVGRRANGANAREIRVWTLKNQFAVEMDHFAEAIRANREPHTPGEEGLQDQKVIAAIYQAAAGGGVVKMPTVTGLDTTRGPYEDG